MQPCTVLPTGSELAAGQTPGFPLPRFAHETLRPHALLSIAAAELRGRVRAVLERAGWDVAEYATGFDLVHAVAGLIEGAPVWRRPDLIIVDAWSRGCAGWSLAAGFAELGVAIPIVVIDARGAADQTQVSLGPGRAYVVEPSTTVAFVSALVRRLRGGSGRTHADSHTPLARFQTALIANHRKEETPYESDLS